MIEETKSYAIQSGNESFLLTDTLGNEFVAGVFTMCWKLDPGAAQANATTLLNEYLQAEIDQKSYNTTGGVGNNVSNVSSIESFYVPIGRFLDSEMYDGSGQRC